MTTTITTPDTRKATKARIAKDYDEATAIDELRNLFPIGSTVTTLVRHVSSSGMSRSISVVYGEADGSVTDITWIVARATGMKTDPKNGGIKMGGYGLDMGFALVYSMASVVYSGSFYCTGKDSWPSGDAHAPRCPSNDHMNERHGQSVYSTTRLHSDAGYALNQRWV